MIFFLVFCHLVANFQNSYKNFHFKIIIRENRSHKSLYWLYLFLQRRIWRTTDECTRVKSLSNAASAACNFPKVRISKTTRESILASVRTSAKCARKRSRGTRRCGIIGEFTREKSLTAATRAALPSIRPRIWRTTQRFIPEKSRTSELLAYVKQLWGIGEMCISYVTLITLKCTTKIMRKSKWRKKKICQS